MNPLSKKKCVACAAGTPPLKGSGLQELFKQLSEWRLIEEHHIEKEYKFKDFKTALAFTNQVGWLAEEEGHHPDIYLAWGKVKITLWTHKINGLSESDLVMAAKIDELFFQPSKK